MKASLLPIRRVRSFEELRRVTPISLEWGDDRGQCVDRYYIERFLAAHACDIRGRVLEIQVDAYTRRFGGKRVARSDVIHVQPGNPKATIVADLASAPHVPSEIFDCIICTQTLLLIYELKAAVRTLYRILKPGAFSWSAYREWPTRSPATTWTAGGITGALRVYLHDACLRRFLHRKMFTLSHTGMYWRP